jgi:hypothetical protein
MTGGPRSQGSSCWRAVRQWAGCGEGQVGPRTLPWHGRPLAAGRGQAELPRHARLLEVGHRQGELPRHARPQPVARWASRIAARGLARPPMDAHAARPDARYGEAARTSARRDPLLDPLAVTEHCVIGDQIRLPAACCDIVGCGAEFADLASLGEADNRARALAAGWSVDAFGRLVCPACQRRHDVKRPRTPRPERDAGDGPAPAATPPGPRGGSGRVQAKIAGVRSAVSSGRHRRARWLLVLAALASGNNGWGEPQPVTGPAGTGRVCRSTGAA